MLKLTHNMYELKCGATRNKRKENYMIIEPCFKIIRNMANEN